MTAQRRHQSSLEGLLVQYLYLALAALAHEPHLPAPNDHSQGGRADIIDQASWARCQLNDFGQMCWTIPRQKTGSQERGDTTPRARPDLEPTTSCEQATGARSGRGRAARPPGGHRHSATSRPATGPATGDEPWGPATCNVPTADSIILGPFSPTLAFPPLPEQQQPFCSSRYPLRVCFQSFRCLPACVPQYSCPSSSIDRHIHFSPSPRHSAPRRASI